jgi:hypothetical protein
MALKTRPPGDDRDRKENQCPIKGGVSFRSMTAPSVSAIASTRPAIRRPHPQILAFRELLSPSGKDLSHGEILPNVQATSRHPRLYAGVQDDSAAMEIGVHVSA